MTDTVVESITKSIDTFNKYTHPFILQRDSMAAIVSKLSATQHAKIIEQYNQWNRDTSDLISQSSLLSSLYPLQNNSNLCEVLDKQHQIFSKQRLEQMLHQTDELSTLLSSARNQVQFRAETYAIAGTSSFLVGVTSFLSLSKRAPQVFASFNPRVKLLTAAVSTFSSIVCNMKKMKYDTSKEGEYKFGKLLNELCEYQCSLIAYEHSLSTMKQIQNNNNVTLIQNQLQQHSNQITHSWRNINQHFYN